MKHVWKILFLIPIFILFQVTYSGDIGVNKIDVVDQNTLKVTLSENPNMKEGSNEGEITILNDIGIASAVAKTGSSDEIEVFLNSEILPNTSYSLLTVAGTEGSIDFTTPADVEGFTQVNVESLAEQDIESLEIIDAKTILLKYKQNVSASAYDFKFLAESKVVSIEKPSYDIPEIFVKIETPLVSEQDYILMFIDLKDVDGVQLEFDTGIYDFKTPVFQEPEVVAPTGSGAENLPELNAALDVVSLEKETQDTGTGAIEENNIAEVAATATQTPATGAATWILLLSTLFINVFYIMTRRKKA